MDIFLFQLKQKTQTFYFLINQFIGCIYTYNPHSFGLSSHSGHHSKLSRVPCSIQQVLISYLFYSQSQQCIYANPSLPIPPSFPPLCYPFICFLCLCLYICFANKIISIIFLDSAYIRQYMILVFLFLTYFSLYDSLQVHPCLYK